MLLVLVNLVWEALRLAGSRVLPRTSEPKVVALRFS